LFLASFVYIDGISFSNFEAYIGDEAGYLRLIEPQIKVARTTKDYLHNVKVVASYLKSR
jgi:hypothetical protein